jgi:hypothetical protein
MLQVAPRDDTDDHLHIVFDGMLDYTQDFLCYGVGFGYALLQPHLVSTIE